MKENDVRKKKISFKREKGFGRKKVGMEEKGGGGWGERGSAALIEDNRFLSQLLLSKTE